MFVRDHENLRSEDLIDRQDFFCQVRRRLGALRGLFDRLACHGVLETKPAAPVQGPAYTYKRGKTPIRTAAEAARLMESIESDGLVGLRDRALIAVMVLQLCAGVGRRRHGYRGLGANGRSILAAPARERRQDS